MAEDQITGKESEVVPPTAPTLPVEPVSQTFGPLPDYLSGIRARYAPAIQKVEKFAAPVAAVANVATGGAISAAQKLAQTPQGKAVIQGLEETTTNPEKRLSFVTGLVQPGEFGAEIPGLEGIRARIAPPRAPEGTETLPEGDYVYHATDKSRADAIREQGLRPNSWYANSPQEALKSGVTPISGNRSDLRVFAVPKSEIEPVKPDIADIGAREVEKGRFVMSSKSHKPIEVDFEGRPLSEQPIPKFSGKASDFVDEDFIPPETEGGLYHVTTALDKVNEDGLKSRKETKSIGLGGGFNNQAPDKVSVTFDEAHANMIADRMKLAVKAAKDEITPRQALDEMTSDSGIADTEPYEIAQALRAPEDTYEDWDKFDEWFDEKYKPGDAYSVVQELDDALPELFPDAEFTTRVGFTAPKEQMAKIDPSQIGIVKLEAKVGAKAQHIPDERELRFSPQDIKVIKEKVPESITPAAPETAQSPKDIVESAGGTFRGVYPNGMVEVTLPRSMTENLPIPDKMKDFVSVTVPKESINLEAIKAAMENKVGQLKGTKNLGTK